MFKTKVKFDGSSLGMRGFDTGFVIFVYIYPPF